MPMTNPGKFDSDGAWEGFRGEIWQEEINVRDFIQKNYTPYNHVKSYFKLFHLIFIKLILNKFYGKLEFILD